MTRGDAEERSYARACKAQDYAAAMAIARRAASGAARGPWLRRLGSAAILANRPGEAREAYLAAKALAPLAAGDLYNLALSSDRLGEAEAAAGYYREALALTGPEPRTLNNLGKTLTRLGRLEEAEACLHRALALEPGRPSSELNLAMSLLLRGEWQAGWPYFEARLKVFNVVPPMPYPRWDGKPGRDSILLLRAEQGLGDAIQFARFASVLGRAGMPVILQAEARMVRLLKSVPHLLDVIGNAQVVNSTRHPIVWAPLLSVPGILDVTPATVPAPPAYLAADAARTARWRAWLPRDATLKIGIAWQGNPEGEVDRGRSFPLACFAPVAAVPGVRLVALQKGAALDQANDVPFADRLILPGADFDSGPDAFLDSAALMTALDLVITSDTAIAHLAGALGRPTLLALRRWPDWRWLLDRPDTPWYPQMRLFRQATDGDWDGVFARIAAAVRDLSSARTP